VKTKPLLNRHIPQEVAVASRPTRPNWMIASQPHGAASSLRISMAEHQKYCQQAQAKSPAMRRSEKIAFPCSASPDKPRVVTPKLAFQGSAGITSGFAP